MTITPGIQLLAAVLVGTLVACGGHAAPPSASPGPLVVASAQNDRRPYQEFIRALENTLVEVNELERMGGGIRNRMILVDVNSLVDKGNEQDFYHELDLNYGKIQSLRPSLRTNDGILEVLNRAGLSLNDLVAIDAKSEGAVILYYKKH